MISEEFTMKNVKKQEKNLLPREVCIIIDTSEKNLSRQEDLETPRKGAVGCKKELAWPNDLTASSPGFLLLVQRWRDTF